MSAPNRRPACPYPPPCPRPTSDPAPPRVPPATGPRPGAGRGLASPWRSARCAGCSWVRR
ncbi:hypothetical protein NKH77_09485 [Streptomyces sp. M19]